VDRAAVVELRHGAGDDVVADRVVAGGRAPGGGRRVCIVGVEAPADADAGVRGVGHLVVVDGEPGGVVRRDRNGLEELRRDAVDRVVLDQDVGRHALDPGWHVAVPDVGVAGIADGDRGAADVAEDGSGDGGVDDVVPVRDGSRAEVGEGVAAERDALGVVDPDGRGHHRRVRVPARASGLGAVPVAGRPEPRVQRVGLHGGGPDASLHVDQRPVRVREGEPRERDVVGAVGGGGAGDRHDLLGAGGHDVRRGQRDARRLVVVQLSGGPVEVELARLIEELERVLEVEVVLAQVCGVQERRAPGHRRRERDRSHGLLQGDVLVAAGGGDRVHSHHVEGETGLVDDLHVSRAGVASGESTRVQSHTREGGPAVQRPGAVGG
ncbi:hypothetical protein ABE10_03305, partial [Bacillus toyonensis]|nr:hypothetical protein [Bacillus toyonensis]